MHSRECDPLPQALEDPDGSEEPHRGIGGQGRQEGEDHSDENTWWITGNVFLFYFSTFPLPMPPTSQSLYMVNY